MTTPIDKILTLHICDLRAECEKADLDTAGLKIELQQRLIQCHIAQSRNENGKRGNEENSTPAPKKMKKFQPSDLVCPITLELTWDPVTAEDGRVYERAAIEEHIANRKKGNLKSPMTGLPMGKRLLPALQHKNTIEALIASGVLDGDLAAKWNEKFEEKKAMENLIKIADSGDDDAMCDVASNYLYGENGFKMDEQLAYAYYRQAHDAGNVTATAMLGQCLWTGNGVKKCNTRGWFFMTMAAGRGSRYALSNVGFKLAKGEYGMEADKEEAIRCLRIVVEGDCTVGDASQEQVEEAQELLDELTAVATPK